MIGNQTAIPLHQYRSASYFRHNAPVEHVMIFHGKRCNEEKILATSLSQALACLMLGPLSATALAQVDAQAPDGAGEAKQLDAVVVQGEIAYRDRTRTPRPRFTTTWILPAFRTEHRGRLLKRVPGVTFVGSDIMEFDGVMMRGMAAGYTQVLINGKSVPRRCDRSFWVDRSPRKWSTTSKSCAATAPTAAVTRWPARSTSSSAMPTHRGQIYLRLGVNRWDDGEVNPTFGAVTSGEALGGRILAGINIQDRYRGKLKRSDRFSDPSMEELVSWEDQIEVKDGRDYSANVSYTADVGETGRFSIDGFYVRTDRDVTEVSHEVEYDDGEVIESNVPGLNPFNQKLGHRHRIQVDMAAAHRFDLDFARSRTTAPQRRKTRVREWRMGCLEAEAEAWMPVTPNRFRSPTRPHRRRRTPVRCGLPAQEARHHLCLLRVGSRRRRRPGGLWA